MTFQEQIRDRLEKGSGLWNNGYKEWARIEQASLGARCPLQHPDQRKKDPPHSQAVSGYLQGHDG